MPHFFTTFRRKARRTFFGAAGVYVSSAILLGSLFCLSLAFYFSMRETMTQASATALTGLMLLGASILVLLLTICLVKFSKGLEREQFNEDEDQDLKQSLQNLLSNPDNPLANYIQQNPSQSVLLAAAAGTILGISPAARQTTSKLLKDFVNKQSSE